MNKHPFNNLVVACALIASILLLVGCNSAGKAFDDDNVQLIQKGTTTKSDIRDYFGDPLRREISPNGEAWSYTHMDSRATAAGVVGFVLIGVDQSNTTTKTLTIVFEDDIVKNYEFTRTDRKDSYKH